MSYLVHFNPNHDKLGRFTFSGKTVESRIKNYNKVVDSLTDQEFKYWTDGDTDRKADKKMMAEYAKTQPNYQDSRIFISKYGNVTLASLETNGLGEKEWNMGWATNKDSRGTGVTQSNIKEAISMVREVSDLPISAIIEKRNIASQKTAEKAGFKSVGYTTVDGTKRKRYIYD